MTSSLDEIVALCKRRGFIYPGSEIYGGITGFWDYGPLGVELKRNLKNFWWKHMVEMRDDVVGMDAAIIMNPKVWEASGHTEHFSDFLIECKECKKRFRADHIPGLINTGNNYYKVPSHTPCPSGGHELNVGNIESIPAEKVEARQFNLLVEANIGVVDKTKVFLRGEITQGVFVNFQNVVSSTRVKVPFGIAQIGKAFRNEITPGNFTFRSREFEQMELEFFIKPDEKEGEKWFSYWKEERLKWYQRLGIKPEKLRFRDHTDDERAHYARKATDIEYQAPFGWSELEGIHHRGDWDLKRHNLTYKDKTTNEEFTPWVIETSGGVDRTLLFLLLEAYTKDGDRTILKLHASLAPFTAAVFPLVSNKPDLVKKAESVYKLLQQTFRVAWDDRGNIGKRYFSQDEAGTPFCITIDFQTLEDETVTIRNRDTAKQERVAIGKILEYIEEKMKEDSL